MACEAAHNSERVPERIKSAAITYKGDVYEAPTHGQAMVELRNTYPGVSWFAPEDGFKDGFVTSKGRFVDRVEANQIATAADQINDLDKNREWLSAEWIANESRRREQNET